MICPIKQMGTKPETQKGITLKTNSLTKNQTGLAALWVVIIVLVGTLALTALLVVTSYISANNTAAAFEARLGAERDNSEMVLGQYDQTILEASQVPDMQRDDTIAIVREALRGRYGEDGARAVFQMIQEQNPQPNDALYLKLTQLIESGRNEFKTTQTRMRDTRASYEVALNSVWQGFWMRTAGYPRLKLSDFDVITTDRAEQVFQSGKEAAPIQFRPKPAN